jgi:hypothetical protein
MASWRFSVGNLVTRAASGPAAVSPAVEDSLLPLVNLGSGYPDEVGGLEWRSDGDYEVDFDLNLLAASSERSDAHTGWLDLINILSGTPGLPANPPDWGSYGGRATALRLYRPLAQEVDVMPGEQLKLEVGIYRPSGAAGATGVRVRVIDAWSGKGWNGSAWADGGVLDSQVTADAWKDVAETIDADTERTERSTYRVIIEPIAMTFDGTSYVYASANGGPGSPALYAAVDLVAIIGHNLPADADVALAPQPSGTSLTLTPVQPSCYEVGEAPQMIRTWRLSIQMPAGVQPRPELGEVWIGGVRTMTVGSPIPTFGGEENTPGQLRVEGPRKRLEVVADAGRPVQDLNLAFRARDDASWRQLRDEVMRLTRYGADPLLLLPGSSVDGEDRPVHGRVGETLAWSIITPTATGSARTYAIPFVESPFAGG